MLNQNMLAKKYLSIRNQTLELTQPLTAEDMVVQPIVDVSPPKWHLGHTTWFFETFLLKPHLPTYREYHPKFSFIFNSYYETFGDRAVRNQRGFLTRPTIQEVMDYRRYVDEFMLQLIALGTDNLTFLIDLGLNHEQQHQELLVTDIKYILGTQVINPVYGGHKDVPGQLPPIDWVSIDGGQYPIGFDGNTFCFDNELKPHEAHVESFQIADRVIAVEEYLAFMDDAGYQRPELWLSEGWDWLMKNGLNSPLYWKKIDNAWHYYRLDGFEKLNVYEPVTHISFFEADAFARWSGKRLPTEFEWEIAAKKIQPKRPKSANFLESGLLHPSLEQQQPGFWGSVWEWTNSAYSAYPGYRQTKGALGEYNGKFMINQMVLRGGSCATPAAHIRLSYRNFFHAYQQWQFSGVRLTETAE